MVSLLALMSALFVSRHAPASFHFPAHETFVFADDDRAVAGTGYAVANALQHCAGGTDDVVVPVSILGLKECQVGLRRAQIPRQLVERLAFGIVLAGDNSQVLGQGDGALLFELAGWPLAFRHQRPQQPVHVHAEVMQAAQINIRGNFAALQNVQQKFALGFNDDFGQQRGQRLVLGHAQPAFLVRSLLGAGEGFNGVLPGARFHAVVRAGQIRLGDLQIQDGLANRIVLGLDDLLGLVLIGRVQLLGLPVVLFTA